MISGLKVSPGAGWVELELARGGFGLATDATSCSVLLLGHENIRVGRRDTKLWRDTISCAVMALMTSRSREPELARGGFRLATDATPSSTLLYALCCSLLGHENTRVGRDTISCAGTQVGANDHQEQGG